MPVLPIVEKLSHALHVTVNLNHQRKTMWQLLQRVRYFLVNVSPFPGGGISVFPYVLEVRMCQIRLPGTILVGWFKILEY
ncbi:hypothetical protein VQ7734_03504 [Vibrio quintilis]|uniref:Uncharacterized protein n=1 Tax=Vibrio quintilis TaxID=1117707 RepID=A0A1M7YYS4_9VIBR|nr:hypothetical protein VQ7734_03504 [Vibrio quintilis]